MLILSDPEAAPAALHTAIRRWTGPHCISLSRGALRDPAWIRAATEHFLVLDHVTPPLGNLMVLREVISHVARTADRPPAGPLLFLHGDVTESRIRKHVGLTAGLTGVRGNALDFGMNGAGDRLEWLLLGPKIVSGPLFLTFFQNLATLPDSEMGQVRDQIQQHLVAKR